MVAEGYKQTEIGIIPNDWNIEKLGTISFVTKLAGFEYSKHFNSYKDGGEIIVIRGTNITHDTLDLTDIKTIPRKVSNYLVRSKLSEGDLVFAYVGTIGPVFLIDKSNRYHLGPNTCKITLNTLVNKNYIFSYFKSWLIKNEIKDHTSIGAQPSLSMSKIRNFNIVLPPKSEQKAIATALSDVDELITALTTLIAKKEDIKTAAIQQLLTGKKRLDGFSGEWGEKKLGDIVDVVSGGTPSTSIPSYWNGTIDWYTPTEVGKDKYISHSNRKLTEEGFQNSSAKILPIGTILFTSRAGIGDTSILMSEGCTNQGFQSLVVKKNIDNEFVYYLVSTLTSKFLQNASGSTFLEISPNQVRLIDIIIPGYQEQQAIATILSDMDKELEALKTRLEKTKAIKIGMIQELLTGKTRLVS